MNIIFILGKIVSEIEFKFIIKSKNTSIAMFKVELLNKSIVKIKCYNELADYSYSKLNKDDNIFIEGYLNSKMKIVTKTIKKVE